MAAGFEMTDTAPSIHPVFYAIALLIVGAILLSRVIDTRGPLDPLRAEGILDGLLRAETVRTGRYARVDVVTPDGEKAEAPVVVLHDAKAVGCPKASGSIGSVPGRSGGGSRTYAQSAFKCLFKIEGPAGLRFFLSAYVLRSTDPSLQYYNGGHNSLLLGDAITRELMQTLGKETRVYGREEQAALWAELARHDIYVAADKSQVSPFQREMRTLMSK